MSYINDALKKAQEEKDGRYRAYGHIISGPAGEKSGARRKRIVIGFTGILLLSIAVSSFYHLYVLKPAPVLKTAIPPKPAEPAQDIPELYRKALDLQKSGDLAGAEQLYCKILEANPNHANALNNIGVIYIMQNRKDDAARSFQRAIASKPDSADPYYNLACLHAGSKDIARSLDYLWKAVQLNPEIKKWAKEDRDLQILHASPEFKKLTE